MPLYVNLRLRHLRPTAGVGAPAASGSAARSAGGGAGLVVVLGGGEHVEERVHTSEGGARDERAPLRRLHL